MYIVTFYSFKGGVGRTMALANIAYELAKAGKRVLVVDFDLEAPGLDTLFPATRGHTGAGIVDYVSDYLRSGVAPSATDYVYQSGDEREPQLWVMPAGAPTESYGGRLNALNWGDLYANRDGYLLFEDLKEQWRETIHPDYVLIDSRTGHTDVAGICTRQLPDAVVALFLPNEQNLRGLRQVVEDIRSEEQGSRGKRIALHFAMSNVPDLDDEEEIVKSKIRRFRQDMGARELHTIYRYDSLALLDQAIFTKVRPRSRLAREYRDLLKAIRRRNTEDQAAVLSLLQVMERRPYEATESDLDPDAQLQQFADAHPDSGEVLTLVGSVLLRRGAHAKSLRVLERAYSQGHRSPRLLALLAQAREADGAADAVEVAVAALDSAELQAVDVRGLLEVLRLNDQRGNSVIADLHHRRAVMEMSAMQKMELAAALNRSHNELTVGLALVDQALSTDGVPPHRRNFAEHTATLASIGLGKWDRVIKSLSARRASNGTLGLTDQFNLAMALWGKTGVPASKDFRLALQLFDADIPRQSANTMQCMAMAQWAVGDAAAANQSLAIARRLAASLFLGEFSCWRYLFTSQDQFIRDLDMMDEMIAGGPQRPAFLTQHAH